MGLLCESQIRRWVLCESQIRSFGSARLPEEESSRQADLQERGKFFG